MRRLFTFIVRNRAFFTFLILEFVCAWLIFKNNSYQGAKYFNSSNVVAAKVLTASQNVNNYLSLRIVNQELAEENARLRQQLEYKMQSTDADTSKNSLYPSLSEKGEGLRPTKGKVFRGTLKKRFDFISARVINNSVELFRNFITINKGKKDGLAPGMAVINSNKTVGKVKVVSENFSVVISMLNLDENISSVIHRTASLGTVQWNGRDPRYSEMKFVPRHVTPLPGDSIFTSGLNAVFPEKILVGIISRAHLKPNAVFWDITLELAQDFTRLQHVEVIRSVMKPELDSIQNIVIQNIK